MKSEKVTPNTLLQMKREGKKFSYLVVYDYPLARILDECGIDMFLVGDSLGQRALGRSSNLSVTVDEIIYHTQAVVRGAERALVVADMPFMAAEINIEEAKRNAGRLMQEGGADAVKIEGGVEMAETIRAIVSAGIPVMGHIGFNSQSIKLTGTITVRGTTPEDRDLLINDAKAIQEAGVFSVGLVRMDTNVAAEITRLLKIPTNGIGAGPFCDGFALVLYDLIGLTFGPSLPKHVKQYVNMRDIIRGALRQFTEEIATGTFPNEEHSY